MSKIEEIESATGSLSPEQKQEVILFLATRLRSQGSKLPEPRQFSREQMMEWVKEDEADMARFGRYVGQMG